MRIRSLFKERKRPIRIFFSYASEDEALQQQLESHLSIFRQNEAVSLWHKRVVYPGEDWQEKVHEGMLEADVILLLASADYVKSDYLWQHEMLLALRRHERGEALVAPVLLRPLAGLEEAPFGKLQPLPFNRKPATTWATLDDAFSELAGELITLLERKYAGPGVITPGIRQRYNWRLTLDGDWEEFSPIHRREVELGLWKLTGDPDLEVLEVEEGSIQLSILSSEATYEKVKEAYKAGILEEKLSVQVMALSEPVGAAIRVETRIVDGRKEGAVAVHTSLAEAPAALPQYPALLTGFTFNSQNPFAPGFILGHPRPDELGQEQAEELQKRMGEYLNTFLVVRGEDMHVDLNPYKDFCGIPEPLRKTRLGWDLLRQDLDLKRFTTQLLHPGHETGSHFWKKLLDKTESGAGLESCFKVWITPDSASVHEKQEGDTVQVDITGFRMKVSCDFDYQSAEKLRKNRAAAYRATMDKADEHALAIFKEAILPRIQEEVDQGDTFGLLRQIYTVLICAKWYMSHIGGQMPGFVDSNDTEKYGLEVIHEDPKQIQREYQHLFEEGAWATVLPWYDGGNKQLVLRQFVVGRIGLADENLELGLF